MPPEVASGAGVDFPNRSAYSFRLMELARLKPFLRLLAALAMLLFVGDLVADSISDAMAIHCASESSQSSPGHEKSPCSHCSCATHIGAVVAADFTMPLGMAFESGDRLCGVDQPRPTRLAGSIDHPPQLA